MDHRPHGELTKHTTSAENRPHGEMTKHTTSAENRFTPSKAPSHDVYQHTPSQESPFAGQESQFMRHDVYCTPLQESQRTRQEVYRRTPLQEPQRSKKPRRIPLEDITNLVEATSRLAMGAEQDREEEPGSSEKTSLFRPEVPAEPVALFRCAGKLNSQPDSTDTQEMRKQQIQYGAARRMRMV